MILAEIALNLDTIAGGSVTGMLAYIMIVFIRRTSDVDRRSDDVMRAVLDAAREQEQRLWVERDRALKARDDAREEANKWRARYEELLNQKGAP